MHLIPEFTFDINCGQIDTWYLYVNIGTSSDTLSLFSDTDMNRSGTKYHDCTFRVSDYYFHYCY